MPAAAAFPIFVTPQRSHLHFGSGTYPGSDSLLPCILVYIFGAELGLSKFHLVALPAQCLVPCVSANLGLHVSHSHAAGFGILGSLDGTSQAAVEEANASKNGIYFFH